MKKTVTALAAVAAAVLCCRADGNFSVQTNDATVTVKAIAGSLPTLTEPFFKESVSNVIFDTSSVYFRYNPTVASTYDGGSEITKGQLTIDRGDAFGTGPVTVGTTGMAALMVRNRDVTIPNKVVFNRSDAYAVGFGDTLGSLTLKSIGTGSSLYKTVRLGREGAGSVGRVTLSLTDPDSEAVRQLGLQGAVRLSLDGGTVRARADAENPFFRVVTAGDAADITVAANGVAFDVPADSTLELGQPLAFESAVATNVVGACAPENASFEDGLTGGWTYTTLVGGEDDSGIKQTPCPWDGDGKFKPHGGKFAMVRQGVRLSTAASVPEDGLWRVVFWRGGRPGGYSVDVGLTVSIGDGKTSFPASSVCDFMECKTAPTPLAAGAYTLSFETSNGGSGHSLNIDNVSLERVELEPLQGKISKTGAGTLLFDEYGFGGGAVSVVSGALDIRGQALAESAMVDVSNGAALTLSAFGKNVVTNGGFEADGPKDFASQAKPRNWTLKAGSSEGWGLQSNGGTLTSDGPRTPQGSTTVFLRENVAIGQRVTASVAGNYRFSFLVADRRFETSQKVPVSVSVDGAELIAIDVRGAYADFTRYTVDVGLAAGQHEIEFTTGQAGSGVTWGNIVLVDDVSLRHIRATDISVGCDIRMETGATLELDASGKVSVGNLFVDGVRFRGGCAALVRAGVSVTGAGRLWAGEPAGMAITIR